MEIEIRTVDSAAAAREHFELLRLRGLEALSELGIAAAPDDFMESFLTQRFEAPESLLLVAESKAGAADLGLCLVGPHSDPLSGVRTPMILILSVETNVRHRGLARALVKEARRQLKRRGFPQLAARSPHGDDPLISMGERWGFLRTWEFLAKE